MSADQRTAVLLGAGASADAGLLLTSGLARRVVEIANESSDARDPLAPAWIRALNAVYAGMVGYQGSQGDNPLAAVNIETLISAVRLLKNRDGHEVAPFVASWAPALSAFASSDLPNREGQRIIDAVAGGMMNRGFEDRRVTEAVAEIARAALRPDLEEPFEQAEIFVVRTLVDLLSDHKDVSYLHPLLELARTQRAGLDVITLNYDLTIETAASGTAIHLERGVEKWRPGEPLDFPQSDGTLNLLKLHGSLDWRLSITPYERDDYLEARSIDVVSPRDAREHAYGIPDLPWIVVGDREKLATDGPTLALNSAAKTALRTATHLTVVGYSFSDFHINAMVRDWLAGDEKRTMSILDHSLPRERFYKEPTDFRSALIARHATGVTRPSRGPRPVRVKLIEGTARERLAVALLARPGEEPNPLAEMTMRREGGSFLLSLTWHGDDLADGELSALPVGVAWSATQDYVRLSLKSDDGAVTESLFGRFDFESWRTDETKTFIVPGDAELPIRISLDGGSIAGAVAWSGTAEIDGNRSPAARE